MTTLAPTLYTRYFPGSAVWLRDLSLIAISALCVAAFAQIRILLPFTPVPLTGQTFAVLLVGAVLGSRLGTASLVFYTALGATGLPVFAGGGAGLTHMSGPTLGYLVGFVAAAYFVGRLAERGLERSARTSLVTFLAGTMIIYLFGAGWLAFQFGLERALSLGVLPFLVGDTVKIVTAALVLPAAWKLTK